MRFFVCEASMKLFPPDVKKGGNNFFCAFQVCGAAQAKKFSLYLAIDRSKLVRDTQNIS